MVHDQLHILGSLEQLYKQTNTQCYEGHASILFLSLQKIVKYPNHVNLAVR